MPYRSFAPALTLAISLAAIVAVPALANEGPPHETGSGGALLDALGHVPSTLAARDSLVSYLDQGALVSSRPGAARPATMAEALAALEEGDAAAQLWLAALMGAASGATDLLSRFPQAADWPERLGFDLLDVERQVSFGTPPSDGTVLIGRFDPGAIAAAHESRGYTSSQAGEWTRLCGPAGCDAGLEMALADADPTLPFGAELGRREPLAVSETGVLVSADLATLEGMEAAAAGEEPSLAEDPAYRALALAVDPGITLTQATFLPGEMLGLGPDIYQLLTGSPEAATELLETLDRDFESLPPAKSVAILDGTTSEEQVVTIGLAYEDEPTAARAAEALPRRLETLPATSFGVPLSDLLDERGVTSVSGTVVPPTGGALAVARVEVRAPLAGSAPEGDASRPARSGELYRLFMNLVNRRDLLWLVPVLPLE